MSLEILGIVGLVLVPGLVWVWKKFGGPLFDKAKKIELIQAIVEGLADGELTEAESKRIVEEIKKLFAKDE